MEEQVLRAESAYESLMPNARATKYIKGSVNEIVMFSSSLLVPPG
jgi:hypothetical protein